MKFNNYSETELLKLSSDLNEEYDSIKIRLINLVDEIELKKNKINELSDEMNLIEEMFINIREEIKKRSHNV